MRNFIAALWSGDSAASRREAGALFSIVGHGGSFYDRGARMGWALLGSPERVGERGDGQARCFGRGAGFAPCQPGLIEETG